MSESIRLDKDLISDPQLWRLAMRVEKLALQVVLYNTVEDNSLIYRKITLDQTATSPLKALEEAIYENQLLLSDFSRIDCVIDTNEFVVVPSEISSIETQEKIMTASFPDFKGEMMVSALPELDVAILMGVEREIIGFIRRTFNNPRLHHHLSPLCRYFSHKSKQGNTIKMYANLRAGNVDLMAFSNNGLLLANTFAYREPMDAVYYILSCRKMLGLDASTDELYLVGAPSQREAVAPVLREYIAYVMPVIFPSAMFKAGKEAMKAPFDLIVLPLCE